MDKIKMLPFHLNSFIILSNIDIYRFLKTLSNNKSVLEMSLIYLA